MEKNSGNLKRVFTPHSSSSSGLSKREKVKWLSDKTMSSGIVKNELPKKDFCDSIPRKLRSALTKRSCKSASKHSINGVASLRKIGCSMPITKEEEEVAETLFALAGMTPLNGESSEAKTHHDDPMPSSEDPVVQREEGGTACDQAIPLMETSHLSLPKLSERRQLNQDLKASVPQVHLQGIPPFLRTCDGRQLTDSANISQISTAPICTRGVNNEKIENVSFPLWQSQHFVDPRAVETVTNKGRDPLREMGPNGLHIKSSASVSPSWDTASSSRICGDNVSLDKASSSVLRTVKKRKRCITHVYISHLIQEVQVPERKDNQPLDACQLRPSQLSSAPDKNGAFTSQLYGSTTYLNRCETGDILPMNPDHPVDKDGGSKKQGFDFLSLSNGVSPNAKCGANRLHSVSQAGSSVPQNRFSTKAYRDQVAVASMAMPPGPPQVQLQMPQYFANAFNSALMSHTTTANATQFTQPRSQQQQMWTSHLAAQFRPGPLLPSHITNWQNRRQDPRILTQHKQPLLPPSQPSLETIGAKYLHISQHQQQLMNGGQQDPRIPTHHIQPQTVQLPSVCEDKGGRFQPDGVVPF